MLHHPQLRPTLNLLMADGSTAPEERRQQN